MEHVPHGGFLCGLLGSKCEFSVLVRGPLLLSQWVLSGGYGTLRLQESMT